MTLRRVVGSVSVVAVGVLGLSACGSDKPAGVAPFTPSVNSASSSPTPTSASKWTPEQQQVIEGYDRFNNLVTAFMTKAEAIDVAKARQVAKEPFASVILKGIDSTISAGFVQEGKLVRTVSSVVVAEDAATIKACVDETHMKIVNPGNPSGPAVRIPPPSWQTVSVVRIGRSWLVAGLKSGGGACVGLVRGVVRVMPVGVVGHDHREGVAAAQAQYRSSRLWLPTFPGIDAGQRLAGSQVGAWRHAAGTGCAL